MPSAELTSTESLPRKEVPEYNDDPELQGLDYLIVPTRLQILASIPERTISPIAADDALLADNDRETLNQARAWAIEVASKFRADPGPILTWLEACYRTWGNPWQAARMALREYDLWG